MPIFLRSRLLFGSLMFSSVLGVAQQNPQSHAPTPATVVETNVEFSQRDPQIVDALKQISPDHIRATIEKLVSFKNRSTLSSNDQEMISKGFTLSVATQRQETRNREKDTVRIFSEGIPAAAKPEDIIRIRDQGGENDSTSRELAGYIRSTARQYQPATLQPTLIFRRERFLRGGDHTAFNEEGFAGVRVGSQMTPRSPGSLRRAAWQAVTRFSGGMEISLIGSMR